MSDNEAPRALNALVVDIRKASLSRGNEKHRVLKSLVQEGLDDVATCRVVDWQIIKFLAEMEDEERTEPRVPFLK